MSDAKDKAIREALELLDDDNLDQDGISVASMFEAVRRARQILTEAIDQEPRRTS